MSEKEKIYEKAMTAWKYIMEYEMSNARAEIMRRLHNDKPTYEATLVDIVTKYASYATDYIDFNFYTNSHVFNFTKIDFSAKDHSTLVVITPPEVPGVEPTNEVLTFEMPLVPTDDMSITKEYIKTILDMIFRDLEYEFRNNEDPDVFVSKEGNSFMADFGWSYDFLCEYRVVLYKRYGVLMPENDFWRRIDD